MTQEPTKGAVIRLVELVLASGAAFHYGRIPTYFGTVPRVEAVLALASGESLLDVGCGTGLFAPVARGTYVGIDTARAYLRFGQRRAENGTHFFVAMSVLDLGFAPRTFDKAIVVNLVHHLDAAAVDQLLIELNRIVRRKVVLMDAAPEAANRFERFLLRHDRGDYIRDRAALRALLGRHFEIESEDVCHNALRTVPQVIFGLVPKTLGL